MKDLAEVIQQITPDDTRLRTAPVKAVSGSGRTLTVTLDGTDVVVPRLLGWTPYAGDIVLLIGSNGFWYAIGCTTAQQAAPTPPPIKPPIPPDQNQSGTTTFNAQDSGSWRNGGWRGDTANVVQGDWTGSGTNSGAWFYGDAIKATLGGRFATAGRLYIPRISGGVYGNQTAGIAVHDRASKSGTPGWSGVVATFDLPVNAAGWANLPASAVQGLLDAGGGLGLRGSQYFVANAVAGDRQSGTLQIDWKTRNN